MPKNWIWLLTAPLILSMGLTACKDGGLLPESDGGGDSPTTGGGDFEARDIGFEREPGTDPETNPTISFFTTDDGRLGIRVNGMDLGDGNGVQEPVIDNFNVEPIAEADDPRVRPARRAALAEDGLSCDVLDTGESGSGDKFDIVVSLDTTASMGSQASVFADKIVDFAGALEDQGLDVRFAGVTVGDAYATIDGDGNSAYTSGVAQGTLGASPGFDSIERPDTGLALITADDMKVFFGEVSEVVGSGQAGGDGPENFLAPIDYFNQNVAFREDAGRFFIAIGDQCAHTADTLPGSGPENEPWLPRAPEDIQKSLVKQGVAVNLIWADTNCGSPYYDMHDLQKATGGAWTKLSSGVDLTDLPTIAAVGDKRKTLACTVPVEGRLIEVTFDVAIGDNAKWFVTAILEVNNG